MQLLLLFLLAFFCWLLNTFPWRSVAISDDNVEKQERNEEKEEEEEEQEDDRVGAPFTNTTPNSAPGYIFN